MNRVLVTGGTGFIGQHVVPLLVDQANEVHAVHWHSPAPAAGGSVEWHHCDVLAPDAMGRLVEAVRPTHLLHLAWYAVPGRYWTSPENLRWLEASLRLVRVFADGGGKRVVLAGTCAEYDWDEGGVCSEETTPLRPRTLYGVCKHALQSAVSAYARETGLSTAWGRVFFVYGPAEHVERLVPSVTRSLLSGQPARVTHGGQRRDFLHVQDVAAAFAHLIRSDVEGPVNVGSGTPTSLRDLLTLIGTLIGRTELLQFGEIPTPRDDPPLLVADVRRIRDHVGWRPQIPLEDGIIRTVEWWRRELQAPSERSASR